MYFDENILRIIYNIPEGEDISEDFDLYMLGCFQTCSEALVVFNLNKSKKEQKFIDAANDFNSFILSEQSPLDIEKGLRLINKLCEDKDFDKTFQEYLDVVNAKLINDAAQKDSSILTNLQNYLFILKDALEKDYLHIYVSPLIGKYVQKSALKKIEEWVHSNN